METQPTGSGRAGAVSAPGLPVSSRLSVSGPLTPRGACPTLARPMETGDGLLVRLRPQSGGFTSDAFLALLDAAERCGNGRLDITARGNLQIRGLTADSVAALAATLDKAGIVPMKDVAVETPPLAGLDPSETADPRPLAALLSTHLGSAGLSLAPKLSIVVDGGGLLHLGELSADLRLDAVHVAGDGGAVWRLSYAGTAASAIPLAFGGEAEIVAAMSRGLRALEALGPSARGRDLDIAMFRGDIARSPVLPVPGPPAPARPKAPPPVGQLRIGGVTVLGLAPAFGQMGVSEARAIVRFAMEDGLSSLRLAPGRSLLLLGLSEPAAGRVAVMAGAHGFLADPADPALRVDACAGAGACASGGIDTQATARLLLSHAPALFDGSLDLHVSGCAKGCAHPRASGVTLVAVPGGYGLVLDGTAATMPVARAGEGTVRQAVTDLGLLVGATKQGGESAASCLKRLGPARIAATFQRD